MNRHAIALLTAALLLGVSCAHYRFGSALPKDMRDISVSEINNTTAEPSIGMLLQDALAEHIMNTPGVKLASRQDATLDVSVKIVMIDQALRRLPPLCRGSPCSGPGGTVLRFAGGSGVY